MATPVIKWLLTLWLFSAIAVAGETAPPAVGVGNQYPANDSLRCGDEQNDDARSCLANLSWQPAKFTMRLEPAERGCGDFLVRFPSPRPVGNRTNDLVAMEWFAARDADHAVQRAPAVVVVHESGRRMTVGRLIARGLSAQGLHAFLLHLPGYGARRVEKTPDLDKVVPAMLQSIADVRRARDAVVALPVVDSRVVGLQGTSLGGFVVATVAGLDHGYDRIFIVLAGGNVHQVLLNNSKEVAKTRAKLAAAGVTDDKIKELANQIEPLRLAHRIDPARTWLYSGKFDNVVPPACAQALAKAARLAEDHFIEFPADHYSGILYLPKVLQEIHQHMTNL
jgi:dienelactone hydrolase